MRALGDAKVVEIQRLHHVHAMGSGDSGSVDFPALTMREGIHAELGHDICVVGPRFRIKADVDHMLDDGLSNYWGTVHGVAFRSQSL